MCEAAKGELCYLKGGHQARIHSEQIVLMMARREAEPRLWWPNVLIGELENNSRKPKELTKNRHDDSIKNGQLLFLRDVEEGR